jgi:type IV secretory pathway VirB4 component
MNPSAKNNSAIDPGLSPTTVSVGGISKPPQQASAKTPPNANSTQNTLEIAEIRDGIVIMHDGSFRSVIMAKSINFDLMSGEEQEAVEFSYQGFLNSLYYPVQIFVRSQQIDLGPYVDNLDNLRVNENNMLLAVLMEDYANFIESISEQSNVMSKSIYVVIPYFPTDALDGAMAQSKNFVSGLGKLFNKNTNRIVIDEVALDKAKVELRNRVQATLSGLSQCGVQGLPLDTQELIELYYDIYNPDTSTQQHLPDFHNVSADVIQKGTSVNGNV